MGEEALRIATNFKRFKGGKSTINKNFNTGITYWLEHHMKIKIKVSTYAAYQYRIEKYIHPYFIEIETEDIQAEWLQSYVLTLINANPKKVLSSNTVGGIISLISDFFEFCISINLVKINPCQNISLPKRTSKKIMVFTDLEQQQMIEALLNEQKPRALLVLTALFTGMRIGELCSLNWDAIDLEKKLINVVHTKQRIGKSNSATSKTEVVIGSAKTKSSVRTIHLSSFVTERIKRLNKAHVKKDGMVFVQSNGKGYDVRSIQKYFSILLTKLSIEKKGFHSLRHTFATKAIESGMDVKTLSIVLGHSSITTTMNLYVHPNQKYQQSSMESVTKLMEMNIK